MEPLAQRVGDGTRLVHPQWLARESRSKPGTLFFQHILTGEVTYERPPGVPTATSGDALNAPSSSASSPSNVSSSSSSSASSSQSSDASVQQYRAPSKSSSADERALLDKARSDMILYFESLARTDDAMAQILLSLPSAFKIELESYAFRRRTTDKFRELSSSNAHPLGAAAGSSGTDDKHGGSGGGAGRYVKGTLSLMEVLPMVHRESVRPSERASVQF